MTVVFLMPENWQTLRMFFFNCNMSATFLKNGENYFFEMLYKPRGIWSQ
jgi:hypothetical protein